MNEVAADTIQNYIYESLFEPHYGWPKIEFDRRSYARWAANEILSRVKTEGSERSVLDIIEEFRIEMDHYSVFDSDRDREFIFITARETAEDIGSLFV